MFPVPLSFYLAASSQEIDCGGLRSLLPGLDWGWEGDLLKHSDEWPAAVALIREREGYEEDERCDFPVELNLVRFPGREKGKDAVMLAVKLALLRRFAQAFECRVLCDARGFCMEEAKSPFDGYAYSWTETFLCQGGRVYGGAVLAYEAREGYRPARGWLALDDLPEIRLNPDGTLADGERAVARLREWMETRDAGHLRKPPHPVAPEEDPGEPEPPLTLEEIEAEIEEEFPSEEEIEAQEAEWEVHAQRLNAWERGIGTTSSKLLIAEGIALPPPDSLDDLALSRKLWEVIHGLERKSTFLSHTGHLSNRELYTWLWEEGLNELVMDLSGLSESASHTSPIGSGDEEAQRIGLIYYDSAEERAEWKAQWPDDPIPAHLDLPHDRDRHLPKREVEEY